MIKSFRDTDTKQVYDTGNCRKFPSTIMAAAVRKLGYIDAAIVLTDLVVPPGNRLEALKGNRLGQHSIRVNDQFRICFTWVDDGAEDVELTDYH